MASDNPYHTPLAAGADLDALADGSQNWKAIARRWEMLRVAYNLVVGAVGLGLVLMSHLPLSIDLAVGIVLFGLAANLLYLLGPVSDMYLNWLADFGEHRFLPAIAVRVTRSWIPTALIFTAGTCFALLVTLAAGFSTLVTPV